MDIGIKLLIDLANQECLSGSFNGPALVETLRLLSPEEAASTETYEGYSAWSVALHVLYFKHLIASELGEVPVTYDYEKADFPKPPDEITQASWDKVIGDIEATHRSFADGLAAATTEKLEATYESWKIPLGKAVAWAISHDSNHNAQIRNMGLPTLKQSSG